MPRRQRGAAAAGRGARPVHPGAGAARREGRVGREGLRADVVRPPAHHPREAPSGAVGGREYLRRRLRERSGREEGRRRAEETGRTLHGRLSAHAEAAVLHPPQDPRLTGDADGVNVLNAAYLVTREQAEGFVALVGRADGQEGVRVELTGPWAPYSFAGIAEEEEAA
ncbi:GvpL/GvpF family gas vesicle protein [Streptomyces sp. MRC013]|uniref:GvpL/GvpF family gas vesicle protein n=1 Tax=Streptomyces sp. MRC013 TaxID=2898276 RepID=UPI0032E9F79B